MSLYNIVVSTNESTVVAEYEAERSCSGFYQNEADLEREFIRLLETQGYEHLKIHDEAALITNLRKQLELLNNCQDHRRNRGGGMKHMKQWLFPFWKQPFYEEDKLTVEATLS